MSSRYAALIIPAICIGLATSALPSGAKTGRHSHHHHSSAASQAQISAPSQHSRHHKHPTDTASAPQASHSPRSRRERALLAKLQLQEEQLYQLRHERNAFSARTKALKAKLAARKSRRARAAAAQQLASSGSGRHAKHASAKQTRAQSLHAQNVAPQQAHLANLHAMHVAQQTHAQNAHQQRLAMLQAHQAKLHAQHLARLAQIEAKREQHKDKPSHAVNMAAGSGLSIWQGNVYAAQVPVKVVTVDLNDQRVKVSALLASNGIGTSEPFTHMISRAHPNVAVTGTFFSLDNLRPVGDIVINGSLAYFGGMGTALAITPDNRADMITVPWGHHHNWSGYETVVACGPRLLRDGSVVLDPHMEHFKDRHMLSPNSRIAVGVTGHNQLVFCMTRDPIYLGRLAKIMKSLGCKQAMNLDAGTSTGFYCNGNMMARPGRRLTNAIVVYANHKPVEEESASAKTNSPRLTAARRILSSGASALRTVASVEVQGER